MKPTKNKVYCTDCGRTKMLFPSEEKANNFILFNAEEMMADGGKAPARSYFCAACGGWHVTKYLKSEYFEEKDRAGMQLGSVKARITDIINEFNTSYDRSEPDVWRKKLTELGNLADELDALEPGMTPLKLKIKKCRTQYEYSIHKAEKKKEAAAAAVTPEMNAAFKDLKLAARSLKWGRCVYLACQLNTGLGKLMQTEEVIARTDIVNDFIRPERVRILKPLFMQTVELTDNIRLLSPQERDGMMRQIEDLLAQAVRGKVNTRNLKGVHEAVKAIGRTYGYRADAPAGGTGDGDEAPQVQEARGKVIQAIDLIKEGRVADAEDALHLALVYLHGYEGTAAGDEINKAIAVVAEKVAAYRCGTEKKDATPDF